jgi:transposase
VGWLVFGFGDNRDVRGPLAKNGPKYLRWALIEAATHAARDPHYRDR